MADQPADATMERIAQAVTIGHTSSRAEARRQLVAIWDELGPDAHPLHRCVLAHYLADLQDDPHEELRWDQRALDAADALAAHPGQLDRPELEPALGGLRPAQLYPSLHLNLADCHRRLGDGARARAHAEQAAACAEALDDDGYGRMIRGGVMKLLAGLDPPDD